PKLGLEFVHLDEAGFAEHGAAGFNLATGSRGTNSLQPFLGLAAAQKFSTPDGTVFTPELRFGYAREVLSNSRLVTVTTLTGAAFPIVGVKPSRDQIIAGLGVSVLAGANLSLYANYDAIVRTGNTADHTLGAGLRWKF